MKSFGYIWRNAKGKIMHVRMAAFLMVILTVSLRFLKPLADFARDMEYPVSVWVFPFLLTRDVYLLLLCLGAIYVNADVPFMQYANMYQVVRVGRKKWAVSQIAAVFLRSVAMTVIAVFCSVVSLIPQIEWTADWGKLLWTIVSTGYAYEYNIGCEFYYEALDRFAAPVLMGLSVTILILILTFLGLLMYAVCLYADRIWAVAAASGQVILLFFAVNIHAALSMKISRWTPVIWAQVARVYSPAMGYYGLPSIPYMVGMLLLLILLLCILILHRVRRVEFDWEKEDV